jgi:hypothetical protein
MDKRLYSGAQSVSKSAMLSFFTIFKVIDYQVIRNLNRSSNTSSK